MQTLVLIAVVTLSIQVTFFIFRKVDPIKEPPPANFNLEELKKKYKGWDAAQVLGLFVVAPVFSGLVYLLLREAAVLYHAFQAKAEIMYTMMDIYWWLPSMLIGILLWAPVLNFLIKRFMRPPYDLAEYEMYQSRKLGFKTGRMSKIVLSGASLICAGLMVQGMATFVALRGDELDFHSYLSLSETRHPLSDIREIRTAPFFTAPDGNKVARREYLVFFQSGGSWSTTSLVADLTAEQKAAFLQILSQRSGKPIQEVPVFGKDDL